MINVIVELSKYLMIIFIAVYSYLCFTVFKNHTEKEQKRIFNRQNRLMFLIHFIAYMVLFLKTGNKQLLIFYGAQ